MNERSLYNAIQLSIPEEAGEENEVISELYTHLCNNGYHFYLTNEPGLEQIYVLLIREGETGYIDTILQDRGIEYEYVAA